MYKILPIIECYTVHFIQLNCMKANIKTVTYQLEVRVVQLTGCQHKTLISHPRVHTGQIESATTPLDLNISK